jgi:hypothetical protein
MISRLSRLAAPAILTSALVALSACGGSTVPSTPSSAQNAAVGRTGVALEQAAIINVQPNGTCPKNLKHFNSCYQVSKSKGLELGWCYGPKYDPCSKSDVGKVKWTGVVCLVAGKTCPKPIKELTGKMTGPFKCSKKIGCDGTWDLDTITPGAGLKETKQYLYKQDVRSCRTPCDNSLVGLNVGP